MADRILTEPLNPLQIQFDILTEWEKRLDGNGSIVDPNNTASFLLEAFSRVTAEAMVTVDQKLNSLYPKRAQTINDLYNHISDFDYVGLYAYPASLRLSITMHRQFILDNAIEVPGSNYRLIVIPKDTSFRIGKYVFGLYYPIIIRVSDIVDNINVLYDTTELNPLHSLNSNSLVKHEFSYNGVEFFRFEFDAYQFETTHISEAFSPNYGFNETYTYSDKFYAVRIFSKDQYGEKVELAITLSEHVYDPAVPTAFIRVLTDKNQLIVRIPQIYFDDGLITGDLYITLMTTLGELDVYIANIDLNSITTDFALNEAYTDLTYSSVLNRLDTFVVTPLDTRLTGGSNAKTFDEVKNTIVYHSDSTRVPITNLELDSFFTNYGFRLHKRVDNLTDRSFYGLKKLQIDDKYIGILNATSTVFPDSLDPAIYSTVKKHTGKLVILPSSIYRYSSIIDRIQILTDNEINTLLNTQDPVEKLNTEYYFFNPFHYVVHYEDDFPTVNVYNMLDIDTDGISFERENIYVNAQSNLTAVNINHDSVNTLSMPGDGGYTIRIGVQKSADLVGIPEADIVVFLTFKTMTNTNIGIQGTFIQEVDGISVYDFKLMTDYDIIDDSLAFTNLVNEFGFTFNQRVPLAGKAYITTHVKKTHFPGIINDGTIQGYFVIDDGSYLSLTLQSFNYKFGSEISRYVDNNFITNWSAREYATHQTVVYDVWEHDVYETDVNGNLVYTIDATTGAIILNKLHAAGDTKLDAAGNPIIKHNIGDMILTECGDPIITKSRALGFTIDMFVFDLKHAFIDGKILNRAASQVQSYFTTVKTMQDNLLENTDCYFRPITTMGETEFKITNSVTATLRLDMSFALKCYVPQSVYLDSELKQLIEEAVRRTISNSLSDDIISFVDICNAIADEMSDYVNSVDIVSINGDSSLQTIAKLDVMKEPMVRTKIVKGADGVYRLTDDIEVIFEPLDV